MCVSVRRSGVSGLDLLSGSKDIHNTGRISLAIPCALGKAALDLSNLLRAIAAMSVLAIVLAISFCEPYVIRSGLLSGPTDNRARFHGGRWFAQDFLVELKVDEGKQLKSSSRMT